MTGTSKGRGFAGVMKRHNFAGQRASFSDDGRGQLAADYVVFYVNQIQRQKPYPGLVDYFRAKEPVFVLDIESTGKITGLLGVEVCNGRSNCKSLANNLPFTNFMTAVWSSC